MTNPQGYCVTGSTRVLPAGIVMTTRQVPAASADEPAAAAQTGPLRHFAGGKLRSSYERHYIGDVIIVRTSSGYELTVTPNHPIATPGGWVPAAELQVGSDVLCSRSAERRMHPVSDNENNVVPAIKQVAQALPLAFTTVTWPVDFHGDGPGSEVHVVRADSFLMSDLGAALGEHPGELLLISGDHGTRLARAGGLERSGPATTRSPVRLGDGGRARIPGGTSQRNPGCGEHLIDLPDGDPCISGDGDDGFAGQIAVLNADGGQPCCGARVIASSDPVPVQDIGDRSGGAAEGGGDSAGGLSRLESLNYNGLVNVPALGADRRPERDVITVEHLGDYRRAAAESRRGFLRSHSAEVHADDGGVIVGAPADEPPGPACAGTTANLNPALAEKLLDTGRTDPQAASDFREWLTTDVTPRQIVSIQRGSFDGHVYDLGTNTGVFTGETILCGPCELRHQEATGMSTSEHAALIKGHKAAADVPALPKLITIPGVDILAAGTWQLSSGRQTFTRADLTAATEAASCPAVGPPVIKIGHLDDRFTPDPSHDGEPAIGKVTNLRADPSGNKLIGDMAGMPGWLGAVAASAFPRRSVEGTYNFPCQIGHTHPFVITAVALLGVTPPGVGVLGGLDDIAALYGLTSTAAAGWRTPPADQEGHPMAVTEEDVRRAYYAAGGAPPSWWITELQMDPTQLIVADEATTKVYRVPFRIDGSGIEFGDPQEFATYSDVAASRGTGPLIVFASAAESRSVTAAAAYEVRTGMPGCDGHAVVDTATGKMVPKGCHPDRGSADAQMMQMMKGKGGMAATGARLDRLQKIRAAVTDTDPDDSAASLAASLDALLDQAATMIQGIDRTAADPMLVQLADMVTAAETVADELMEALGIPDPDDTDVNAAAVSGGETLADWPVEDQTGDVEAAPAHAACSTTHEHPHPAFGSQGSDQTHTHDHTHTNDAVHNHAHDPTSAASAATAKAKGAPEVEFTSEQLTAMKAKLGKKEDEDLTAADIAAAFTAPQVAAAASNGGKGSNENTLPPIGDGTYLVDGEIIRDWQTRAARGDHADHQLRIYERDVVLAAAVRDGKFPQAKLDVYKGRWDKDPEGTRELVESLAAGLVPMGGAIGSAGGDPDLPGDFEEQKAYRDLYPEDAKGGVSHAPGVRGGAFRG